MLTLTLLYKNIAKSGKKNNHLLKKRYNISIEPYYSVLCKISNILCCMLFMISLASPSYAAGIEPSNLIEDEFQKYGYVWFETNAQTYLDNYIKYAKQWEGIGRPIATARIFNIEAFIKQLYEEKIFAIGGFKTSNVFEEREYHDFDAWKEIASVACNVSELTNGKPVILENEGAVKKLLAKGVTSINYQALLKAISAQQWPEIWFWYAPTGRNEPLKTMSYDIARAVMSGIPNARLIEHHSCGYAASPENPYSKQGLERTLSLDKNPLSIIYLDNVRYNFWKYADTRTAIENAAGNSVILYPGHEDLDKSSEVKKRFKPSRVENLRIIAP